MKLSKLWALLKASKYITKWEGSDTEWLSDGRAFFPVYGLPTLTEQALRTMLDVDEEKWTSYSYREEGELPFSDLDNFKDDEELHVSKVTFTVWGVEFLALTRGLDIYLVNVKKLKPLEDGLSFYFRDGYIAVKEGMVLRAVLMPEIITDDMVLAELMSIATKLHDAARDEQLREFAEQRYKESTDGQQLFEDMEEGDGDES